jgi:hypothetical protein
MKSITRFAVASAAVMAATPAAFAQSSGNFNATVAESQCVLNTDTGALSGGILGTMLTTTITTPNGNGTTLLITPSFVTGLFTDTQITQSKQTSAQTAAVQITVKLDGKPVPPATVANPAITYDERFQQLSSNVFNQLLNTSICSFTTTTSVTVVSSVTSTVTLTIGSTSCSIDLILSTMSAHSFNFVAQPAGGNHSLEVDWAMVCSGGAGQSLAASNCSTTFAANTAAACVGPGDITVQQVKNFSSKDGTISIQ